MQLTMELKVQLSWRMMTCLEYSVLTYIIYCLTHNLAVQGQATGTGPENIVTQTGDEVILGCHFPSTTGTVSWYRDTTKLSNDDRRTGAVKPWTHQVVGDFSTKEYNMKINTIDGSRDEALYGCRFPNGGLVYIYKAHLIVIDGTMSCTAEYTDPGGTTRPLGSRVIEGDVISVTCSIDYLGGWAPDILCESDAFNVDNIINSTSTTKTEVTTTFSVSGGLSQGNIVCDALFQDVDAHFPPDGDYVGGIDHYFARNTPTFKDTWPTWNVDIEYGPMNVTIEPIKAEYAENDVITCYAMANPTATFEWKDPTNSVVIATGADFTITTALGYVATVKCVAQNTVSTGSVLTDSQDILISIPVPETTAATTEATTTTEAITTTTGSTETGDTTQNDAGGVPWWIYLIAVLAALLLIFVIALAIYCRKSNINKVHNHQKGVVIHVNTKNETHVQGNKYKQQHFGRGMSCPDMSLFHNDFEAWLEEARTTVHKDSADIIM